MPADSECPWDDPTATQQRFLSLFLRSEREVFRYVAALVPNVVDAEDIVQQTAMALWQKFDAYDPAQPFTPWTCRFALNKARQWIERRQRWQALLEHGLAEELAQRRQELQPELERRLRHLEACLGKLPPAQRSLVEAYYYERTDVEFLVPAIAPEAGAIPFSTASHRPRKRRTAQVLALAACLLLTAAGVWNFWFRPPVTGSGATSTAVALLTRAVDARWGGSAHAPRTGSALEPGWSRLESGLAQLVFYSGARVVFEGPAELRLVSASEAVCRIGRLLAEVPQPARGFRVKTDQLVQGLDRQFNSLFMCDGFEPGTIHWLIRHDGVLGLTVIGPGSGNFQILRSPPVLTPDHFGLWLHLAAVLDGNDRQVVHYVNGSPVARPALRLEPPFRLGPAELGNWNSRSGPDPSPLLIRHLSGSLDEFELFGRALSDEEIRALYADGTPDV